MRIGFNGSDIANTSVILVNSIILVFAIVHWARYGMDQKLFWIGFGGSVFDTIGKVASLVALEYGPGGVGTAITELAGPCLVVVVALFDQKMIKMTELLALILCIIGSFFLVIPDTMMMIFLCRCNKR